MSIRKIVLSLVVLSVMIVLMPASALGQDNKDAEFKTPYKFNEVMAETAWPDAQKVASAKALTTIGQHGVITTLGSHVGNVFFMGVDPPFTKPCKYELIYCFANDALDHCSNMLSIALSAKAARRPVFIWYQYDDESDFCYASLIHLLAD